MVQIFDEIKEINKKVIFSDIIGDDRLSKLHFLVSNSFAFEVEFGKMLRIHFVYLNYECSIKIASPMMNIAYAYDEYSIAMDIMIKDVEFISAYKIMIRNYKLNELL